ncbi:ribokinase [Brachybacterium subflavum]|uniref:ribokinase n=1 Tax=Brachybacterium subflavum TaxID=2585206 RepID=UPI0012661020|nr:ribokinase [Brachybacterium subflavum]
MEHTGTVWVVGSLNVDTTFEVEQIVEPGQTLLARGVTRTPGGKGLNQAVAAARHGARTLMIGATGADDNAALLRSTMAAVPGLDGTGVTTVPDAPTGEAMIQRDRDGENSIIVSSGANARLTSADVEHQLAGIRPEDVVVCQLEIGTAVVATTLRAARSAGAQTVLNAAPAAAVPHLLADVSLLVVNENEARTLLGDSSTDPARDLFSRFGCVSVVTRGGAGSQLCDEHGTASIPAREVEVVDTTGAGDAFVGTLAAARTRGAALGEACQEASDAAAAVCTVAGAFSTDAGTDAAALTTAHRTPTSAA